MVPPVDLTKKTVTPPDNNNVVTDTPEKGGLSGGIIALITVASVMFVSTILYKLRAKKSPKVIL